LRAARKDNHFEEVGKKRSAKEKRFPRSARAKKRKLREVKAVSWRGSHQKRREGRGEKALKGKPPVFSKNSLQHPRMIREEKSS